MHGFGADVDRYSSIAADSHRLLRAGLSAHKPLIFQVIDWRGEACAAAVRRMPRIDQLRLNAISAPPWL